MGDDKNGAIAVKKVLPGPLKFPPQPTDITSSPTLGYGPGGGLLCRYLSRNDRLVERAEP